MITSYQTKSWDLLIALVPVIDKRRVIRCSMTVLFEDFTTIIWLREFLTFSWVVSMATMSFGTCCHGYHGNAIDLSLSMSRSVNNYFARITVIYYFWTMSSFFDIDCCELCCQALMINDLLIFMLMIYFYIFTGEYLRNSKIPGNDCESIITKTFDKISLHLQSF